MIIDIRNNDEGDVDLSTGDFSLGESTLQHQRDLIISQKGHYKNDPLAGVGALNFLHDENPENFMRTIRKELTRDGMKVKRVGMNNGTLTIDADYKE